MIYRRLANQIDIKSERFCRTRSLLAIIAFDRIPARNGREFETYLSEIRGWLISLI
jgi:hypothetical protein